MYITPKRERTILMNILEDGKMKNTILQALPGAFISIAISVAGLTGLQAQNANKAIFKFSGAKTVSIASGGAAQVKVQVALPANHHLYAKHKNPLSMNILTTFAVDEKSGFAVRILKYPAGLKLKDDDYILTGKGLKKTAGTYTLEFYETKGRPVSSRAKTVKVKIRNQLCNSKTNLCYYPKKYSQNLKFRISKPRKVNLSNVKSRGGVNWINKYNDAFAKARKTGQNVFVVITAPSWCYYCKVLERDTFSKSNVQSKLNGKFIPLQILDTNNDKRKFRFSGYPTLMLASPNGKIIKKSLPRSPSSLLSTLASFEKEPGGDKPEPGPDKPVVPDPGGDSEAFSFSIQVSGTFVNQGDGNWVSIGAGGARESYKEKRRDANYIILQNKKTKAFLAMPRKGGSALIWRNNRWEKYMTIRTK